MADVGGARRGWIHVYAEINRGRTHGLDAGLGCEKVFINETTTTLETDAKGGGALRVKRVDGREGVAGWVILGAKNVEGDSLVNEKIAG